MKGIVCVAQILRILPFYKSPLPIVTKDNRQAQPQTDYTVLIHEQGGKKTFRHLVRLEDMERTYQQDAGILIIDV